jgi:hypothetical protein
MKDSAPAALPFIVGHGTYPSRTCGAYCTAPAQGMSSMDFDTCLTLATSLGLAQYGEPLALHPVIATSATHEAPHGNAGT